MNRWLSLLVLGSLLCLANPGNLLSAQITIDSEAQFTFARHLMEKKAYTRAITEFERLIYFFRKRFETFKSQDVFYELYEFGMPVIINLAQQVFRNPGISFS